MRLLQAVVFRRKSIFFLKQKKADLAAFDKIIVILSYTSYKMSRCDKYSPEPQPSLSSVGVVAEISSRLLTAVKTSLTHLLAAIMSIEVLLMATDCSAVSQSEKNSAEWPRTEHYCELMLCSMLLVSDLCDAHSGCIAVSMHIPVSLRWTNAQVSINNAVFVTISLTSAL